jgi:hypothetical protein
MVDRVQCFLLSMTGAAVLLFLFFEIQELCQLTIICAETKKTLMCALFVVELVCVNVR